MSTSMHRLARVLQLRRLRAHRAEQAARRCRDALAEGRDERDKARDIEAAWLRSARELEAWLADIDPVQRVRWTGIADARRDDVTRSIREAREYVAWCEGELERLQRDADLASAGWRREQTRVEALERRRVAERRALEAVDEERTFQEIADAAASARAAGGAA